MQTLLIIISQKLVWLSTPTLQWRYRIIAVDTQMVSLRDSPINLDRGAVWFRTRRLRRCAKTSLKSCSMVRNRLQGLVPTRGSITSHPSRIYPFRPSIREWAKAKLDGKSETQRWSRRLRWLDQEPTRACQYRSRDGHMAQMPQASKASRGDSAKLRKSQKGTDPRIAVAAKRSTTIHQVLELIMEFYHLWSTILSTKVASRSSLALNRRDLREERP